MLSGFVSLAPYQEQMQSVASLHGQVGQLVVQLREAHADANGAQQQLQQERQVSSSCGHLSWLLLYSLICVQEAHLLDLGCMR